MTLDRLSYKIDFDAAMLAFLKRLDARKPVLYCGDLNCAHQEIDVFEPAYVLGARPRGVLRVRG